jgi:peptide/nickel transport system permease protein
MNTPPPVAPALAPAPRPEDTSEPQHRGVLGALLQHRNGQIGCVLVVVVVLAAILGAAGVTPYNARYENTSAVLSGISLRHLFGTDQFGRDVFSTILQGIAVSLEIAALAVLIAGGIGTMAGIAAGFLGRWPSVIIMRITDIFFAIPAILLALAIVTALGPGWLNSALAIGIGYIPIFVRVVRGPVLALREADFIRAGRVLGFSRTRLLMRHILPNVGGAVAVQTSLALSWAVLAEASLSFLGLGPPPPTASLGEMVSQASSLAGIAWWTLAGPSIAIVFAVIGFNFVGDGLRDAFDPRQRSR